MSELSTRLSQLSPERQKLLERLVAKKTPSKPAPTATLPATTNQILTHATVDELDPKGACRQFYDIVSQRLDSSEFGAFSFFLNYGYVADFSPQFAAVALPEAMINRNSVKLVLEVLEDCIKPHSRVLDAGCGRGGTVATIGQYFSPRRIVGLDLSAAAMSFCRRAHTLKSMSFLQGDSERLPFAGESFDIVTNVESSSCYPNVFSFYSEVMRVLAPGGYFLYTDCLPAERLEEGVRNLKSLGFKLERERDITGNVLASCDQVARARTAAYGSHGDGAVLGDFLGAPGTHYYEEMRARRWLYKIFKFVKPASGDLR